MRVRHRGGGPSVADRIARAVDDCGIDLSQPLPRERAEVLAMICETTPNYVVWSLWLLRKARRIEVQPGRKRV
jgi:hypothetical protein